MRETVYNIIYVAIGWAVWLFFIVLVSSCGVLAMTSDVSNEEAIGGYTPIYKQLEGYEHCYNIEFQGKDYIYMKKR